MIRTQYSNSNSLQLVIGHVIFGLELGHVDDQLAARLVPLAVVGLLLQLLEHPFPGSIIFLTRADTAIASFSSEKLSK